MIFLDHYLFQHSGHCNTGWVGTNTEEINIGDCFEECVKRSNVGYFAFAVYTNRTYNCACYKKDGYCQYDGRFEDFNSYRIIKRKFFIMLWVTIISSILLSKMIADLFIYQICHLLF